MEVLPQRRARERAGRCGLRSERGDLARAGGGSIPPRTLKHLPRDCEQCCIDPLILPSKADLGHVRFGPEADVAPVHAFVDSMLLLALLHSNRRSIPRTYLVIGARDKILIDVV